MNGSGGGDFERWLERELPAAVASGRGRGSRVAPAAYRLAASGRERRRLPRGVRGAASIAVALLAILVGGAAAMAAAGRPGPVSLGRQVVLVVVGCQAAGVQLGPGVGQCAGDIAPPRAEATPTRPASSAASDRARAGGLTAPPVPAPGPSRDGPSRPAPPMEDRGAVPAHQGDHGDGQGQGHGQDDRGHPR
jgi:hypothetical protein